MTDYLWEREECNEQREKTLTYKKMKNKFFFPKNLEKWDRDRFKKVIFSKVLK